MSYTASPATVPVDRMRLIVGDTNPDDEGLTDEVYEYALTLTGGNTYDNEITASITCLRFLVAKYANYVTEKTGGIFIKESEKFEQYKKLLDLLIRDPRTSILSAGLPYAGGISWSDYEENLNNPDNRSPEALGIPDEQYDPTSFRSL